MVRSDFYIFAIYLQLKCGILYLSGAAILIFHSKVHAGLLFLKIMTFNDFFTWNLMTFNWRK